MNLNEVREDPEKQKGGTPIHVGDATFFVRRWGTPESIKFKKEIELELFGPTHRFRKEDDNLVMAHWLADYGVTKWENVNDENGEDYPYSIGNARKVFLNKEYFLSLNQILVAGAINFENYLYDEAEEDVEEIKKP